MAFFVYYPYGILLRMDQRHSLRLGDRLGRPAILTDTKREKSEDEIREEEDEYLKTIKDPVLYTKEWQSIRSDRSTREAIRKGYY